MGACHAYREAMITSGEARVKDENTGFLCIFTPFTFLTQIRR